MENCILVLVFLVVAFAMCVGDVFASHLAKTTKKPDYSVPSQTSSYMVPTADPNVVHNHYAQTGGDEIRTKDSYYAYCKVWVKTTISKSFASGFPRINPDGTYYPGDGFLYSFSYGWGGGNGCRNFKICPLESEIAGRNIAKCDLAKLKPLQKSFTKAQFASLDGAEEIPIDYGLGGSIQLTVAAERYFCVYPKKSKIICGWTVIASTGRYGPNVLVPKAELVITQEPLRDRDGFVSGNADKTYYLWDVINLVHTPTYKWKDERFGTISVLIKKQHDLKLERVPM